MQIPNVGGRKKGIQETAFPGCTENSRFDKAKKIIDRLSTDLKEEFPGMKGFSPRNLKYMRAFAQNYPEREFVQEVLAQITWYHNIAIFEKIKKPAEREWYIHKTVEYGWSRNILVHQIESGHVEKKKKKLKNRKISYIIMIGW